MRVGGILPSIRIEFFLVKSKHWQPALLRSTKGPSSVCKPLAPGKSSDPVNACFVCVNFLGKKTSSPQQLPQNQLVQWTKTGPKTPLPEGVNWIALTKKKFANTLLENEATSRNVTGGRSSIH